MKTVCVYHNIDLDGQMSAAIVKHWFIKNNHRYTIINLDTKEEEGKLSVNNEVLHFIGYNYGQPIPDLSGYDKVIIVDISFPEYDMDCIVQENNQEHRLIWIDHHISAINLLEDNNYNGLRDTNYAACELTWKYFFPNEPMPEIVRLLGRYDCFGHKGTDEEQKVLEFQYGARQCISNYEDAYSYLVDVIEDMEDGLSFIHDDSTLGKIHSSGIAIYEYLCTEAKQAYKNGFRISFSHPQLKIVNFICINKERFNPINFGIDYNKDGYDGAACFHYANGMWNFSLYNDNSEVDCSQIAKQYGGGGHRGAAGFVLDWENFIKLIKTK